MFIFLFGIAIQIGLFYALYNAGINFLKIDRPESISPYIIFMVSIVVIAALSVLTSIYMIWSLHL